MIRPSRKQRLRNNRKYTMCQFARAANIIPLLVLNLIIVGMCEGQDSTVVSSSDFVLHLPFDGNIAESTGSVEIAMEGDQRYSNGLNGQAISLDNQNSPTLINVSNKEWKLDSKNDFSVKFWVRTTMPSSERAIILSTKELVDNSMTSQRQQGWSFSIANGTWGWNMGSGKRRISYERTNGEFFQINDGRWHQLAMTYDSEDGLIRLYFDGQNWVTYNVRDSGEFEFGNSNPVVVGWKEKSGSPLNSELHVFAEGTRQLQQMLDEFNGIGLPQVTAAEFQQMVSKPSSLLASKIEQLEKTNVGDNQKLIQEAKDFDLETIESISRQLMRSPYTVHQSRYYNEVALLFQLYKLDDDRIEINEHVMERLAKREILHQPSFDLDELKLWTRLLTPEEVAASYEQFFVSKAETSQDNLKALVAGAWNIYHGGLHQSLERDGWDSRQVIIDILKREEIDVLMMQETYSSGDHIAAELGYYFATTIDWDNMFQGANISVLSRYPIKQVHVPPKSTFMNVGTKVSLSQSQDIWIMSNWFGMRNFDDVFDFHKPRFDESNSIPVVFAGDFNAIPHTDGGNSPASRKLQADGFVDAYRSLYPNVEKHPGYTHRSNRRIDQLYFKGNGLKHVSTEVHSEWPSSFPADHYLLESRFELDYSNRK